MIVFEALIDDAASEGERIDRLCELNVISQVRHVCETTVVQDAWRRQQPLSVHGWIYDLRDGLLHDLHCTASRAEDVEAAYRRALEHEAAARKSD